MGTLMLPLLELSPGMPVNDLSPDGGLDYLLITLGLSTTMLAGFLLLGAALIAGLLVLAWSQSQRFAK
jgi:hypothetical protein